MRFNRITIGVGVGCAALWFCLGVNAGAQDGATPSPPIRQALDAAATLEKGQPAEALAAYRKAADAARSLGDIAGEAAAEFRVGFLLYDDSKHREALVPLGRAVERFGQVNDKPMLARTHGMRGRCFEAIHEYDRAVEDYTRCLAIQTDLADARGVARSRVNLGNAYVSQGKLDEAEAEYQTAARQFGVNKEFVEQFAAEIDMAFVFYQRGDAEKARRTLLDCRTRMGKGLSETPPLTIPAGARAVLLNNLAIFCRMTGRVSEGLEISGEARKAYQDSQPEGVFEALRGEASALGNMGVFHTDLGQYREAMGCLLDARERFQRLGNGPEVARVDVNLHTAYLHQGMLPDAEAALDQGTALARKMPPSAEAKELLATFYVKRGLLYLQTNRLNLAEAELTRAQKMMPELPAGASNELGGSLAQAQAGLYQKRGDVKRARAVLLSERQNALKASNPRRAAFAQYAIGDAYQDENRYAEAMQRYRIALDETRAVGDKETAARILASMGSVAEREGKYREAERHYRESIQIRQDIRLGIGAMAEPRVAYLSENSLVYHSLIRLLIGQKRPAEAFAVAQLLKAQTLNDLIGLRREAISLRMTPEQRRQERDIRDECERANYRFVQAARALNSQDVAPRRAGTIVPARATPRSDESRAATAFREAEKEMQRQERARREFEARIYAANPPLAARRGVAPVSADRLMEGTPPGTAYLDFVAGPDSLIVFVAARKRGAASAVFDAVALTANGAQYAKLRRDAASLQRACRDQRLPAYRSFAVAVGSRLFPPAVTRLLGKIDRLVLCPDGFLWQTPFDALIPPDKRHLIESYELVFAYNAALFIEAAKTTDETRRRRLSLFSEPINPDWGSVPFADEERRSIVASYPSAALFLGERARKDLLVDALSACDYLHIATHGYYNDRFPLRSGVALTPLLNGKEAPKQESGLLTAEEILALPPFRISMATLSCCETGRGEARGGEGKVGLVWALTGAGCPTSVVSQWQVNGQATALLMGAYYRNLKDNKPKSGALRSAILSVQTGRASRHPYYWAGFQLFGAWR